MTKKGEMQDYAERWRPQYHYTTLDSYVNDPNGLVYYKGVYHLYYQTWPHQPAREGREGVLWGQHWGHAVSEDLIHWKEQEPALFPDDMGSMWSGTAVVDCINSSGFFTETEEKQGIVVAYSTNTQHIGIAYSTDGGMTYTKVSTNTPVIQNPGIRCFRDPHIFWYPETQKWKMVVAGHSGKIWIYEAEDLVHWTLCSLRSDMTTECPNLIRMRVEGTNEEKWVFTCVGREYFVGTFDGYSFMPETERQPLNVGPDAYAGITFSNMPDGRTVMISWMFELKDNGEGKWAGGHTVPVELKLVKTGGSYRLLQSPVQELMCVEETLLAVKDTVYKNHVNPLAGIRSNCFDFSVEIDLEESDSFTVHVCEGREDAILISYDKITGCMTIDKSCSKYGTGKIKDSLFNFYVDPVSMEGRILKLRLLMDVSVMELFVNDGYYYFVMRINPCETSSNMSIQYTEKLFIRSLNLNNCNSIWFADTNEAQPMQTADESLTEDCGKSRNDRITDGRIVDEIETVLPVWYWYNKTFENGGDDYFQTMRAGQAREIFVKAADVSFPVDIEMYGQGIAEILFRMKDLENFYCISMNVASGKVILWKKVDGTVTRLGVFSQEFSIHQRYSFRIEAIGNALKIYFEGNCIFDVMDDSHKAGQIANNVYIADAKFDFGKIVTYSFKK